MSRKPHKKKKTEYQQFPQDAQITKVFHENPFPDTYLHLSIPFRFGKIKRKRKNNQMSLVGMARTKNGIVAFGDSKASYLQNGEWTEDTKPARKILKVGETLVAICENNQYFDRGIHLVDEWIEKNLPLHHLSVEDFIDRVLFPTLAKTIDTADEPVSYSFLFGFDRDGKPCFIRCRINKDESVRQIVKESFVTLGIPYFVMDRYEIPEEWTIEKLTGYCKDIVETAIYMGDKYLPYNPVGGEIQIETLA